MSKVDYSSKEFELKAYRREAKRAARDLCYGDLVIEKIQNAKTSYEISRILQMARKEQEYD